MLWVEFPHPHEQGTNRVGDERGDRTAAESAAERGTDGVRIRLQRPGVTSKRPSSSPRGSNRCLLSFTTMLFI
jgi:hypothetical protein